MANLPESDPATYPATVPQIETTDLVLGGAGNGPNRIGAPLVERTNFLKKAIDDLVQNSQNLIVGDDVQAWADVLDKITALNSNGLIRRNGSTISAVSSWIDNSVAQGRLTLTSGISYANADASGDRIYYTPHSGNTIALFSNSEWSYFNFSELSYPLSGIAANKNVDIFAQPSGSNVQIVGIEWGATTRNTALAVRDGVHVAANNFDRRYLGTIRTTSAATSVDTDKFRYIWNKDNQIVKFLFHSAGSGTTTYSGSAWRVFDNNPAIAVNVVAGLARGITLVKIIGVASNGAELAVGVNSTINAFESFGYGTAALGTSVTTVASFAEITVSEGKHTYYLLQRAENGNAIFELRNIAISGQWLC